MSVQERPAKKRRFFQEEPEADDTLDASLNHEALRPKSPSEQNVTTNGSSNEVDSKPAFDQETFEAFVGTKIPASTLERLQDVSNNDLERAVNMYLDGSWKTAVSPAKKGASRVIHTPIGSFAKNGSSSKSAPKKAATPEPEVEKLDSMPQYRYIGAFGVEGWATKSGANLIKHGEKVKIERQKILPPAPPKPKRGRPSSTPVSIPRVSAAASKRIDVIVRFTNSRGEEIGRLSRETANWVSTLIDQKVCQFEGTCVYAPERIRTNDTIFLQLRCSLLRTAFESRSFKVEEDGKKQLYEAKESAEEKALRLRQVALVKLFDEINMIPSRSSETTTKHKREGLLQAAEVAEHFEKQEPKEAKKKPVAASGKSSGNSSPPGSSPPSEEAEAEDGKELEQDQLDTLYRKAQSFDFSAPEAEPASTFAMSLRPYQKQALHWMMAKEKDEKTDKKEVSMHPLWEEYQWPTKDMDDKDVPEVIDQAHFYVNPYSGEMSLEFPVQEQNCLGGILADEMGLGKTIEMMSLVHTHKSDVWQRVQDIQVPNSDDEEEVFKLPRTPATKSGTENAPCTTLVVAPMSLLSQWESEAEKSSKDGTLTTMVYYGAEKSADLRTLCCEANAASAPNVIITSYGVVLSEFNQVAARKGDRGSNGGLFSLNYFRIILDEAHHIKNRQSKTAKACYELSAQHRWVLTGTPIVNRLEDLFSLVRFLRVEPWSNFSFWKTFITVPFESKDFMRALDVVQTVLEPLVLRRTKDMKTPSGEALVPLPPKTVEIVEIELSEPEREVYDFIFARAKRNFNANLEAGTVMKAYTSIFANILRLRQSCCHPILTRNKDIVADEEDAKEAADPANGLADDMDLAALIERFTASTDDSKDGNAFGAHVLEQIREEEDSECPFCCEEPMVEQSVTGCWHSACKKCLLDYIKHETSAGKIPRCVNCREPINARDIFEVVKQDDDELDEDGKRKINLKRMGQSSSAKIEALTSRLKALKRAEPQTKSVVFSQFTSFLSLIEPELTRAGISFLRLDGSMAQPARAAVLREFEAADKGLVLLLSLRAGGVGLNLTMARRVWMMDPWWSFAVEAQAIDRVHRMGQTGEVRVERFVVKGSVEERMLRVQDRKKFIATSLGMMSDAEKKMQRLEDIKELLS